MRPESLQFKRHGGEAKLRWEDEIHTHSLRGPLPGRGRLGAVHGDRNHGIISATLVRQEGAGGMGLYFARVKQIHTIVKETGIETALSREGTTS